MKKSSGFSSIPPPSQISRIGGQWLTYSHMSNHYRKLLNVKPRVDSSLAKSATHLPAKTISARADENYRSSINNSAGNSKRKGKLKDSSASSRSTNTTTTTTRPTRSATIGKSSSGRKMYADFDLDSLGNFYENLCLDSYSPRPPQHSQSSQYQQNYHRDENHSSPRQNYQSHNQGHQGHQSQFQGHRPHTRRREEDEFGFEDPELDPKTVLEVLNFKDSSRDSAYEFSSGESRVTTRESTPEKIKLHQILPPPPSRAHNLASEESSSVTIITGRASPSPSTSCTCNWMKEEKYLNFLNAITDEIIHRGVYTNKGLKSLFKRHLETNDSLEPNKVVHLLDCLRCDLGIPKEESLNSLEFGYGSVQDSAGPFFFKSPDQNDENEKN